LEGNYQDPDHIREEWTESCGAGDERAHTVETTIVLPQDIPVLSRSIWRESPFTAKYAPLLAPTLLSCVS